MAGEVLFTPFESAGEPDALNLRIAAMLEFSGLFTALPEGASVAVKIHPGEKNNTTYIRPALVSSVVERLKAGGARPFVTETTTLYCRERYTPRELAATAAFNGFSAETMGCPFVIADATGDVTVAVGGRHLSEVGIAGGIAAADALVVLAHLTGHSWTAGLAGSIKQLGMGCVGRTTKAQVHLATTITIDEEVCVACGSCADACKGGAIDVGEFAAFTDECVRCGVCIGACSEGAMSYSHDYVRFGQALAEAAAGVASHFEAGRALFVNLLTDITSHCDCEGFSEKPIFGDIGVLVSTDPVAVDQASADLLNHAEPLRGSAADRPEIAAADDKLLALFGIEWWRQLEHAEALGAGSRQYRLKELEV